MRTYVFATWTVAIGMLASGCGDPMAGPPDSGPRIDGGEEVALCGRDADCSDGRFCNGEERCMPGEPDADARGCVVFPAPCEVDECDEDTGTCRMCAVPDADDDNVASIPCGGTDCDDTRGDVHPGALEVCDAEGIDEDCNPLTLGTDADGDGAYAPECCYQPPDGPLVCGQDCDDSNDAIGPHASERCNGIDDDCDGRIDEGFDCIQSQNVRGLNACGREGTRRCSETCTWLDDTFVRAESASTCDYCDDSGDGLGEEMPFAREMNHETYADPFTFMLHDDAARRCIFIGTQRTCTAYAADSADARGGVYLPTPVRLGYGPTRIWARVNTLANNDAEPLIPLDGAWALTVLVGTPTSFVGTGPSSGAALPSTKGIAVRWAFSSRCAPPCSSTGPDQAFLEELRPGDAPRTIVSSAEIEGDQDGPRGEVVPQAIWLDITPDDPRTPEDETTVGVIAPILPVGDGQLSCANAGPRSCGIRLEPGTELHLGITASSTSGHDVSVGVTNIEVTQFSVCGP